MNGGGGTLQLLEQLPGRYRGAGLGVRARFRVSAGRACRDVVVDGDECRVEKAEGSADAEIVTDALTWRAIHEGRSSGVEAFAERKLWVRGSLEKSMQFETLFERPRAGGLQFDLRPLGPPGRAVSVLTGGDPAAPPMLLIHGLGATKASWLTIVPDLARSYRIAIPDLPGFGASDKPFGRYDAPWFAARMFELLDALGWPRAHIAGNSMGGRIAMEMAMLGPERTASIACLSPASAFLRRRALWLVRLSRPELAMILSRLPRSQMRSGLRSLFADPSRLQEVWYDAAIDEFLSTWRGPRARMAFMAAARNVYLDEPYGELGFWKRLETMSTPALYVYGERDPIISPLFGDRVRRVLPKAQVHIWDDCGHVPQIEHPARTAAVMLDFLSGLDDRAAPAANFSS